MNISLLLIILTLAVGGPQTPNFYPGLSSAREASKRTDQDLVIFFSKKNCPNCESAWMAFTKDMSATQRYVSTRMDIEDFDGGVFYEMLAMKEVPGWVVFTANGKEKERWSGGWKDASGSPVLFDKSVVIETPKEVTKPAMQAKKVDPSPATSVVTTPVVAKEKPVAAPPAKTNTNASTSSTGFVLQAGYFGSETNAQKMMQDLVQKGYVNFIIKTTQQNGSTFYRIISEVYPTETEATEYMQTMTKAGCKTSIKKTSEI